jgi:hypothetical protein
MRYTYAVHTQYTYAVYIRGFKLADLYKCQTVPPDPDTRYSSTRAPDTDTRYSEY